MPLTREFKETLKARADADPAFRAALLSDAIEMLLDGEVGTGRQVLRSYVNATIGFDALAGLTGMPAKSLMRMLGPKGNPTATSLFTVISKLQAATGVHLEVTPAAA